MPADIHFPNMFTLQPTKDESVIVQARKLTYVQWGAHTFSEEKYLSKEKLLADFPFGKDRQETWIFTYTSKPDDILSVCESFESPCLAYVDKQIVRGTCFAIGSVFTQIQHRKKGYASEMLRRILQEMKSRKGAIACTLYSDIGSQYYERLGWKCHESKSLFVNVDYDMNCDHDCAFIDIKQAEKLYHNIEHQMERELIENGVDAFVLIPRFDIIEWFHARETFYCDHYFPGKTVDRIGALYPANGNYISWFHDIQDSKLVIIYTKITSPESAPILYKAALKEAQDWNLKQIEIWDPKKESQDIFTAFGLKSEVVSRKDSLSHMCFWGKDGKDVDRQIHWMRNEKYAWC